MIDSGYVPDRVSWFSLPEYQDADRTRIDIGVVASRSHGSFKHSLKIGGGGKMIYNWVSFPYLDYLYSDDFSTIYNVLHQENDNHLLWDGEIIPGFSTAYAWSLNGIFWNRDGIVDQLSKINGVY